MGDVVHCLLADLSSMEGVGGFREWAENCGLSSDSIEALGTYQQVQHQSSEFKRLVGGDLDFLVRASEGY